MISTETPRVVYEGSGSLGPFPLSVDGVAISYADKSHIFAFRHTDGVASPLTNGVHYTLSADSVLPDVGEPDQPLSAASLMLEVDQDELEAGEYLSILRVTPDEQLLILLTAGGFSGASIERTLDAIIRIAQELRLQLNRTLTINALDDDGAMEIPAAADRAGKIFAFDDDGDPDFIEDTFTGPQGDQGDPGSVWHIGAGAPSAGLGENVDLYLNSSNGDVYTKSTGSWVLSANIRGASGAGTGDMLKTENLSGLANAATARTNLGLGSAAVLAASAVLQVANNLSDIGNAATARSNLGLGTAAVLAATAVLQAANNLSDLGNAATARANLGVTLTTEAEYLANTANKVLTTDKVWSAATLKTLTDGATVTPDFGAGINFELALGGNRTLANPTNIKGGQSGVIYITHSGAARTLSYGSWYKWAGGVAPALSTGGAGKVDRISYFVRNAGSGTEFIELTLAKDIG